MSSVNKVILVGNLGADPESRAMQNGSVANMRVATTEVYKDRDGNRKEATEWHNVVIFNERLVDFAEKYLRKGSQVYIEGKLRTRKWQDRDGNDRYTTEVTVAGMGGTLTMLDGAPGGGGSRGGDSWNQGGGGSSGGWDQGGGSSGGSSGGGWNQGGGGSSGGGGGRPPFDDDLDDDVPF